MIIINAHKGVENMKIIHSEKRFGGYLEFKDLKEPILIENVSFIPGTKLIFETDSDIILKNTNFGESPLLIKNKGKGTVHIFENSVKNVEKFAKTRIEAETVLLEKVDLTFQTYKDKNFEVDAHQVTIVDSRMQMQNNSNRVVNTIYLDKTVSNMIVEEKPVFMNVSAQSLFINRSNMNNHIYYRSFNEEETNSLSIIDSKANLSFCDYADEIDYFYTANSDVIFFHSSYHPFKKSEFYNSALFIYEDLFLFDSLYLNEGSIIYTYSKDAKCVIRDLKMDEESEIFSNNKNSNIIVGTYCYQKIDSLQNERRKLLETLRNVETKQKTLRK